MKVTILSTTNKPIETLYRAFKTCVSKCTPTEVKIPIIETSIGDIPDKNKMIDLIKRHINHESVLEHINFTFSIEGVSRSLSHQLVRHRLASYSQQSQRYTNGENFDFIIPDTIKNSPKMLEEFKDHIEDTKLRYKRMINFGIPKEDARSILPNATTTNLVMTVNLRELRHFYSERSCIHAQQEIRQLANKMIELVKEKLDFIDYKAKKCGVTCFECKNKQKEGDK